MWEFLSGHPFPGLSAMEIHAPQDHALLRLGFHRPPKKSDMERLHALQQALGLQGVSAVFPGGRHTEYVLGAEFCASRCHRRGQGPEAEKRVRRFIQANMAVNRSLVAARV
jgi:hypothetical protein